MGNLIGMRVQLDSEHPQPFVATVYEEIVDQHPDAGEIDVIFQVRHETDADGVPAAFHIVDYRVFRVDAQYFGDTVENPDAVDDTDFPVRKIMEMDAYGRSGGEDYIFVHIHPEGFAYPSPKDIAVAQIMGSIDFARTESDPDAEEQRRTFVMFVVLNRNASGAVDLDLVHPRPIGIREIDVATEARAYRETTNHMDRSDPRFARLDALHDQLQVNINASFDAKDRDDYAGFLLVQIEALPIIAEMKVLMRELAPNPLLDILDRLRKLLPDVTTDIVAPGVVEGSLGGATMEDMLAALKEAAGDEIEVIEGPKVVFEDVPPGPKFAFPPPAVTPDEPSPEATDETVLPPEAGRPDVPEVFWVD